MITLNGRPRDQRPDSLTALVQAEGFGPEARGIAVAVNGQVIPRARWATTPLADGDSVEIVKIMQGG